MAFRTYTGWSAAGNGHNHATRDIKKKGICNACDEHHRKQESKKQYRLYKNMVQGVIGSEDDDDGKTTR